MARGNPIERKKIGHSLSGEYNSCRFMWYLKTADEGDTKRVAEKLGFKNIKVFPIWKELDIKKGTGPDPYKEHKQM